MVIPNKGQYLDHEQLFRLTFENVAVGMTQVDSAGRFIRVNDKMTEITGYSKEELLQKTFPEITHPDDVEEDLRQANMLRRGEINSYSMEKRYIKKDGNIVWIDLTVSAVTATNGELIIIIGVVVDISKRKQTEEAFRQIVEELKVSEEKFRTLANNISQLAWMADNEGKILWINKRWMDYTGKPPHEIEGYGWKEIIHPEHLESLGKTVSRAIKNEEGWDEFVRLKNNTGEFKWFLFRVIPVWDEVADSFRWFGTATDITKQREIDEFLKKDKEMVENLLYIAAHDLKGPVANMHGFFEVMDSMEPEQKLTIFEHFKILADQLDKTIKGITDILRVRDTDKSSARKIYFKIVLDDILLEFKDQLNPSAISLNFKEKPTIRYIEPFLYSIIKNLISNSIKYSRDDVPPRIEISTQKVESYTLLSIRDNGVGINLKKYGKRIFSPFQRFEVDKATGTGIGLYLIKNIIEKNGGEIKVESTPGEGTTFKCYLKEY